jgi:hypothetical protein
VKLAEYNSVQLVWVLGHMRIEGNEISEQLAREGSSHLLIGLEPALEISADVPGGMIRDWVNRKHDEHWQSICGQRQAKGCLKNCVLKKADSCSA